MSDAADDLEQTALDVYRQEAVTTLVPRARDYVALVARKRELEDELRKVGQDMDRIEERLNDDMAASGLQSMNFDGYTLYRQKSFYCRKAESPDGTFNTGAMVEALRANGLEHCVGLSWPTMRAAIAELAEAGEELPEEVRRYVEVGELYRLRARKS